jgi:hypothetical protein
VKGNDREIEVMKKVEIKVLREIKKKAETRKKREIEIVGAEVGVEVEAGKIEKAQEIAKIRVGEKVKIDMEATRNMIEKRGVIVVKIKGMEKAAKPELVPRIEILPTKEIQKKDRRNLEAHVTKVKGIQGDPVRSAVEAENVITVTDTMITCVKMDGEVQLGLINFNIQEVLGLMMVSMDQVSIGIHLKGLLLLTCTMKGIEDDGVKGRF